MPPAAQGSIGFPEMLEQNAMQRKHFRVISALRTRLRLCLKNPQARAPEMLERSEVKRKHFGIRLRPLTRIICKGKLLSKIGFI